MIRTLIALTVIAGVSALGLGAGVADGSAQRTARLHLADGSPVKLRGTGFVPGERVRVRVVTASAKRVRRVVAGPAGRFLVQVRGVSYDRCNGFFAEAVGSEGSLARVKLPMPLCPPP